MQRDKNEGRQIFLSETPSTSDSFTFLFRPMFGKSFCKTYVPTESGATEIAIEILQNESTRPTVEEELACISQNYQIVVEGIKHLQKRMPLCESPEHLRNIKDSLKHPAFKLKLNAVLQKNWFDGIESNK